jgi:hypothetical protein
MYSLCLLGVGDGDGVGVDVEGDADPDVDVDGWSDFDTTKSKIKCNNEWKAKQG